MTEKEWKNHRRCRRELGISYDSDERIKRKANWKWRGDDKMGHKS